MIESRLVFSTYGNNICKECQKRLHKCTCKKEEKQIANGAVRVHFEEKGRKGAGVTIISGLSIETTELKITTKNLKKYCGVGGTSKDGLIEIQGDQQKKSRFFLEKLGYKIQQANK